MKRGTYHYTVLNPSDQTYTRHTLPVEVVRETALSYLVKYLSYHQNGNGPGYTTWVRRSKVKLFYGHYN
jgi:hypothetical protein